MSAHESASTPPGRAYRWWGVGAIACLVLAGVGVLGAIATAFSSGPGSLRVIGIIAVFALIPVGILGALYCGHKRYRAWFTNAHVSEGLIEEVAEVRRTNDDGSTSYYFMLTVSAAVEGGLAIRRHCTMGGDQPRPEIGQTLRFRHTTLDPDDLEDALFDSIREHQRGTG
ncbi:ABC transporter permease [Mycolicibacterium sp.]|uniref:ABC transporter permease n=1 Tax=Mycolicibacterium sp. TaxID=2320850 RepID=UPI0037CB76DB